MRLIHDSMPVTGDAYANGLTDLLVARLTTTGQLDTTFNSTGYRLLPGLSGDAVGQSVAVQPDGKILIAGRNFTTSTVATAIRLNADGSVDNAFGTNGWLNTDLATGTFDFWFGLTLAWDGKMYLSGTASGDFAAGRYNIFDGFFDGASTHMDQRLWYQQDANFNVTSVSNDAGAVVERYVYAPYGERTVLQGGFTPVAGGASLFGVDEGHQGLSADAETGLVQNRYRYLHVTLGRFTSMDPHPDGPYVDGMNGFEYVRGGPVSATDQFGLQLARVQRFGSFSAVTPWRFSHVEAGTLLADTQAITDTRVRKPGGSNPYSKSVHRVRYVYTREYYVMYALVSNSSCAPSFAWAGPFKEQSSIEAPYPGFSATSDGAKGGVALNRTFPVVGKAPVMFRTFTRLDNYTEWYGKPKSDYDLEGRDIDQSEPPSAPTGNAFGPPGVEPPEPAGTRVFNSRNEDISHNF